MKRTQKKSQRVKKQAPGALRLDLGCGKNKVPGFVGVDAIKFDGVDIVHDLRKPWPWADNSVDEVHCSHFVEHLDAMERVHFVNELYRVLKPNAGAIIRTPSAWSDRAYGDLTHKFPPVVGMWYSYLDAKWRAVNAPHNDFYRCDFVMGNGKFDLHHDIAVRDADFQKFAVTFLKEAATDLVVLIVKRVE